MQTQGQGHTLRSWDLPLNFVPGPLSPQLFERFSLNITQMFLSVRRCAKLMTHLPRLQSRLPTRSWDLPLNFIWSVPLSEGVCWTHNSRSRSLFKVMEFTLHVCSISPEPFERFSLNFTQMLLCRALDSAMQSHGQAHTSRLWDSVALQTAVL